MKFLGFLLICSLLASCSAEKSSDGGQLIPTIYFKPVFELSEQKCSRKKEMIDPDGRILISLCENDFYECLMQGSCVVKKGSEAEAFNYHSSKNGVARFVRIDLDKCPYGYGVRNICLDPYFSVAADLDYYQPGDVIFIPRLVGVELPNGETHNGFLVVRDKGSRIKGQGRFDFFTGFYGHRERKNVLARLGFGEPKNRFEFRLATSEERDQVQNERGYPGLKRLSSTTASILDDYR